MARQFSKLIAFGCIAILIASPVGALYLLSNIELFAATVKSSLNLPIQWQTVSEMQWYSLWFLTLLYVSTGVVGIYFLQRAFSNFAKGEIFNHRNGHNLRLFSVFLFVQAIAKPVHFSLASMLLSMNHPIGQKILSVSLGSNEIKAIVLAMILWVISDLIVSASKLENENKQFI